MSGETKEKKDGDEQNQQKPVDTVTQEEYNKVTKLVSNLNQDNESKSKQLDAFGETTPEQVEALKTQIREMKEKAAEGDPEQQQQLNDEREAEVRSQLGKEIEDRDKELASTKSQLKQITVISKVMNDYAKGVNDDMRSFIEGRVSQFIDADSTEDGKFVIRDEQGNKRYSPSNPSQEMAVDEFFAEQETLFPSAFKAKGINKGSMETGQAMTDSRTPDAVTLANVDNERFVKDREYRESLPRSVRYKKFKELNI